jgi:hypothetical protein
MFDKEAPSSQGVLAELAKEPVRRQVHTYATWRTHDENLARDLVVDALVLVADPEKGKTWDPAKRSLFGHVRRVVDDLVIVRKPAPGSHVEGGERFVRKLLEEDPAGLDDASDDAIERQMDAAAIPVRSVPTLEELVALAEARAVDSALVVVRRSIAPLPTRERARRWNPVPVVAVAALCALGVAAVVNRAVIVARLRGEPIGPDRPWAATRAVPTPEERAASLRAPAFTACDEKRWDECTQKLDQAAAIDPAGENDPRVMSARRAAAQMRENGPPR